MEQVRAVRYYDEGFRLGLLVRDDEKKVFIVPIDTKEIRVQRYRADDEVVSEYFDPNDKVTADLKNKLKELGGKYGITNEAERYL